MKIGLLLEAAETHQSTVAQALEALRAHSAGLDAVVREEIRATLIEELSAVRQHSQLAAQSLRGLARRAHLRSFGLMAALAVLSGAVPVGIASWLLPSTSEMAALRASRAALATQVERLRAEGAAAELRHCGAARRLCARIDRSAGSYGEAADFLVLKGY